MTYTEFVNWITYSTIQDLGSVKLLNVFFKSVMYVFLHLFDQKHSKTVIL